MKKIVVLAIAALASTAAAAQQQPDPAFLQRAIVALQAQRNQALDAAAVADAKAAGLADDLAKAQARLQELESKAAAKPAEEPKP